ncbi:Aste57867_1474 [Aphanomyces stellatus]|uniref:2-dehydropantoate 2-reductase n=1 Tax=Aphanomyces stellatus TaxID=120398 RepID=A0A485KAQ6_9STRA|nr:hypothetical protein As57867_001473 [Aphanomyces stellatus]VFT78690.1 Aste57867_1474 [Aphanomyces stellatus]
MKVGVVGLGAIGSLFFTRILHHINPLNAVAKDRKNRVYALVKEAHLAQLKSVAILGKERKPLLEVPTDVPPNSDLFYTDFGEDRMLDVLLVTVKSTQTHEVAAHLKAGSSIGKDSLIISVQNGLGNVKILKDVLETDNVLHGVTYKGGVCVAPGRVIQGGTGDTIIQNAEHLGDSIQHTLSRFSSLLTASGITNKLVPSSELQSVLWTKLVVNAGINPLAAILNVPNKGILAGDANLAVVEAIVDEAAAVAKAQGIPLNLQNMTPLEFTIATATATGTNICSMCHDMRQRRPTEIAAINEMIVCYGQQLGIPTPHNELMVHLIRAMESTQAAEIH